MKLTQSEEVAYKELKSRGYLLISKTTKNLPDFICDGKDRYEVKTEQKGCLTFTIAQFGHFLYDDKILVIRGQELIAEFKWGKRNLSGFCIIKGKSETTIPLTMGTRDKLKALGMKDETYDALILKLISEYESNRE